MNIPNNYETEIFEVFASLHPIEAYDQNNQLFCNYMRKRGYQMTNDEIKSFIDDFR